jgi:photosystem II stability/assembly factor-like uncharacterized protein
MRRTLAVLLLACAVPTLLSAQAMQPDSGFLAAFRWRSIGPANMTGRVTDIEANPLNPKVIYVGFATGGLWKSVNAGITWVPVFDRTGVHAVSEIALAPSDTSILYVGTGEPNSRNSISPGAGVFKSTDAGRSWTSVGLRETEFIGRILVHPSNPDIVWVAALGHAWGPNRERGLYKTSDGGKTWRQVKFISERAGFVDMALDPSNPNTLYAVSWERQRGPYYLQSGGPGSGLWKSTDGGETWAQISGNGLPTTTWGRAGVALAPSAPNTIYLQLEADSTPNPESVRRARQRGYAPDTTARQKLQSGLFRSTDGGQTWTRMNAQNSRPFYYSQVRVDPKNADRIYWLSESLRYSNDGGKTYRTVGQAIHGDYHAMWLDPNDPDHYIVGEDGGVGQTYDRGRTYDALLQMPVGQFYAVGLDMQRPFWVCGGLQDNGSWCGPSESPRGRITNEDWTNVNGGDGFYAAIDPTDPNVVYSESQGGAIARLDLRTWERRGIRPGTLQAPGGGGGGGGGFFGGGTTIGRMLQDSVVLARGDTTQPATPEQQRIVDSLNARIAADTAVLSRNRYNWSTPFFISSHNSRTLYLGGQRVWKTVDRGDHWLPLSEDLSTRDTMKVRMSMARTGGVTLDATNAETHGTVVALAESPVRPGILWAGTDDGNVWLTRNDGATWENLTSRFPGVPRTTWVSRVEPSPFDSGTVYVTFDGHRADDFHPYVFASSDFGRTFRSIKGNLPDTEYVHVIREDPRRRDLLFLGTELTAYVSTDGGAVWIRFNGGLPPAPVHDLKIHPRDRQIVAATHGRSFYVMDIGPLEQATDSLLNAPVAVLAVEPALLYSSRGPGGGVGARGSRPFGAPNPPSGARIPIRIRGEAAPQFAQRPGRGGADTAQANPMAALFGEQAAEFIQQAGFGGGGGLMGLLMGRGERPASDSVLVVITDAKGDTVRTLYTNARPATLRWIMWDLRRNRAPLGPAAQRDSARAARRILALRDSLRTATGDTATGRAGPGGMAALFRDPQPGEPGSYNNPVQQALGGGGGGGGGFGGGAGALLGGAGAFVEPGTYLVTVRLNGREYRQPIRVERPSSSSALSGGWQ